MYLQAWKRRYSAWLPQSVNLATSKTQQFCETSIFELHNFKNEAILRDLLNFLSWQSWQHQKRSNSARHPSKTESWVQSWRLCTNAFCDFPLHLSKVLCLPRKSEARSYEVLHLSRKITLANLNIWCSKMQPLSGNLRPDLPTSLMNMSLVLRLPRKMYLSKSGPNMRCFVHVDFAMCFAPQRRALLFDISTCKCASHHNGVQSFIWPNCSAPDALASLLFDPPEPQIIGKNTVLRDFPTFSCTWIFFLRRLSLFDLLSSSLLFSFLLFSSLLFSDSSHLCFSSVHIVGSLTSKLPSTWVV